jgi:hypothetical protein
MGIFTDIATSSGGALLQGVLDEADNIARQDAQTNAVVAQNALEKENEAFKLTELAFKNREQLTKDFINNAGELGIVAGELTIDQIADRLVGSIFNNQRSIFEQKDYKLVSRDVAKFLARDMGKEIEINNPYIPAQDLFNQEKEKHSARLSAISKMPNVDKLSHNIEKAEAKVESPEVMFSKAMTIAPISAKAYGILGYYPDTKEGRDALAFQKTSLIVANARFYHPDDPMARAQFMERKLYENQIDPFAALQFKNPMNFRQITSVLDQMSKNTSTQMLMLTNKMNNPDLTEEGRLEIKGQIDQLTLEQMKQVNNASGIAIMQMARQNVPVDQSMISTEAPIVDDGSTGAQIETGERKIKPQRFGTKRKTITQDEPKQQPKKKESILTPGLKLKKDKKDDEVDTTEEIKGTTTKPNPGSGGIRGSRGAPRNTVKVDEQKQEAMIEGDDAQVMQAGIFNRYNQKDVNTIFQNNNPGNIKVSSDWQGETYTGAKGNVYKKYATKAEGLEDILKTISKYNKTNLKDIMSIYATDDASGKVVKDYAGILQRDHDVPKVIDFTNDEHLESLLKGIVHVENSVIKYKNRNYRKAYRQYYKDKDYFDAIDSFLGGTKA